jgi:hypothetical protein
VRIQRLMIGAATAFAMATTSLAAIGPASTTFAADNSNNDIAQATDTSASDARNVHLKLTIPSPQLAQCMPRADVEVNVKLTTEKRGFDIFDITARHIAPNRDYTVFLLEQAGFPFGAAEYIGDLKADDEGNGHAEYRLIVQEAFVSTIVNGQRVRADLNQIGIWFADPKDDDFCFGPNGGIVTPFDGDNVAGGLAFNSANAAPLPLP